MPEIQPLESSVELPIPLPFEAIDRFCQQWQVSEFALFGSVLREDFRSDRSDIDVLVTFTPDSSFSADFVILSANRSLIENAPKRQ